MASVESLLCNSCGAPLDVPASANFVKCNHCNTQLQIHRETGVTFTENIEKLAKTTQNLTDQIAKLTAQQKVADLDRNWELEQQNFMITGKHGNKRLPDSTGAAIGGVVVTVFGLFWTIMAFGITSNSPFGGAGIFPFFGILFIGFGIFSAFSTHQKAGEYQRAKSKYNRQRTEMRRQVEQHGETR